MLARLRQRAARRFPLHELTLPIAGAILPYRIALPADPDGPLDQLAAWQAQRRRPCEAQSDMQSDMLAGMSATGAPHATSAAEDALRAVSEGIHLPYWALLWPSGMALAEAILAAPSRIAGKRTLELGCGLGVTASAALQAGANLTAADCFADALLFCRLNTLCNAGRVPGPLMIDWRTPVGREAVLSRAPFDVALAADVLYEAEDEAPLLEMVPQLLVRGGVFWLAEPGRRVAVSFVASALARGWRDEPATYERVWPTDTKPTRVTVHRFTLPSQ